MKCCNVSIVLDGKTIAEGIVKSLSQPSGAEGSKVYFPKFWRIKIWKWTLEFRFGCVAGSLKALEELGWNTTK